MSKRGIDIQRMAPNCLPFSLGAIVGSARACFKATDISNCEACDFITVNLEDLTASCFACSSDDMEKLLPTYLKDTIFHVRALKIHPFIITTHYCLIASNIQKLI